MTAILLKRAVIEGVNELKLRVSFGRFSFEFIHVFIDRACRWLAAAPPSTAHGTRN